MKIAEEFGVHAAAEKLGVHVVTVYTWRRRAAALGYDADTYEVSKVPYLDISNQRFGKLVAIKPVARGTGEGVKWLCKCDCGGEVVASTGKLTRGSRRSCGCAKKLKEYEGQRFGKLLVLEDIREKGKDPKARCLCDCGNETIVQHNSLVTGGTKSCGCLNTEAKLVRREGQRSGKLTVIEEVGRTKKGEALWRCRCDCGNEAVVSSKHLVNASTKSCGCLIEGNIVKMQESLKSFQKEGTNLLYLDNKKLAKNNTSGITGVSFDKRRQRWKASIIVQGKRYRLGSFRSFADAAEARRQAERELCDPILEKYGLEPTSEERYQELLKAALERMEAEERAAADDGG